MVVPPPAAPPAVPPGPPPPGKIRIIDRVRIPSPDPARVGKFDEIITYQDQALRTYMVTIPAEELEGKTEEEQEQIIAKYIKAQVAERQRWVGREIAI